MMTYRLKYFGGPVGIIFRDERERGGGVDDGRYRLMREVTYLIGLQII